jgi:hypothetical protein
VPVLRYVVPFTNIIANVANETINYTPLAFVRLKKGGFTNFRREQLTDNQRADLIAKGVIGTVAMATMFALTQLKGEDDEPFLEITANGTGDYAKNATLKETGWQEYSFRFKLPNGKYSGWISYQYSPLILSLGFIGNINDLKKYRDVDDETMITLMSKAAGKTVSSLFRATYLDGLQDFLYNILNENASETMVEKALKGGVGAVKGIVPFSNLISQTFQAMEANFGNYKKETRETKVGTLLQDIPYARDMYYNKINILGEPISSDTDKFYSENEPNKIIELLVDKKAVFAPINRNAEKIYDIELGKERMLTDEEFYNYSLDKGQYIKNALEENYDKFKKMGDFNFKKELTSIKKEATMSARYAIADIGTELTQIITEIDGESTTLELNAEQVKESLKIASDYKNKPEIIKFKKAQVDSYIKNGKMSKNDAEKKTDMQINKNAINYAKNKMLSKHRKAEKPEDVLAPK